MSHVYHVVCTHPGISNNARSPTQKFELTQNIMKLVLYVILLLLMLLDYTVLDYELGSDIMF